MSTHDDRNIELIKRCLVNFIREHKSDPLFQVLPLVENSVEGRIVQERNDLWFLGDWVIQISPPLYEAHWSIENAPGENTFVTVDTEKVDDDFVVTDWDIKETF